MNNNDNGFAYIMVMPWAVEDAPDLCDCVRFMYDLNAQLHGRAEGGNQAEVPQHLENNYQEMLASGVKPYLPELMAIAGGSRDHEPLEEEE